MNVNGREYYVIAHPGNRGKRDVNRHAVWADHPDFALCDWKIAAGMVRTGDAEPGCPNCRRVLRQTRQAAAQLQPGDTLTLTPSQLNPPVVDQLCEPTLADYDLTDMALLHQPRAVKGWRALLAQVDAQRVDPAPFGTTDDLVLALHKVERLTVDLSTGEAAAYADSERDMRLIAFCKTDLSAIWHQVTGWSGNLGWQRAANGNGVPATEDEPEAEDMPAAKDATATDLTDANYGTIMSLVTSRRWHYTREEGLEPKEAWAKAIADIGPTLNPPQTVEELNRWIGSHIPSGEPQERPEAKIAKAGKTVEELTREWVREHDWWPKAAVLAHYTGLSAESFDRVRRILQGEGYEFTMQNPRSNVYWHVTRPKTAEELELARLEAEDAEREKRKAELRSIIAGQRK